MKVCSQKPVVLFVGHWGIPTGFARIYSSLLPHFADVFHVHLFAINADAAQSSPPFTGCQLHTNPHPKDLHNPAILAALLKQIAPNILVVLDEPWACARLAPAFKAIPGLRVVLYLAIHGKHSLNSAIVDGITKADRLVAFTSRAAELLVSLVPNIPIEVVPHGVDRNAFHPLVWKKKEPDFLASRQLARRLLFPETSIPADAFLVLNANRNQPFKRIDLCLRGFAKFAERKPENLFLYLHMGSRSPSSKPVLRDELGLRRRILPGTYGTNHPNFSDADLNLLYNACDIGINTSQREGWGLVSFEHAATGAAQIVPAHSACAELWNGTAQMLDVEPPQPDETYLTEGQVTVESIADTLNLFYCNLELRTEYALRAYKNATRPELQWKTIARQWTHLLLQELVYG